MLRKITLKKLCNDSEKCSNQIQTKIENITGKLSKSVSNIVIEAYGHISISHEQNKHIIWLFLYDSDKIHESESEGKIITQNSDIVRRFKGMTPTKAQLESL